MALQWCREIREELHLIDWLIASLTVSLFADFVSSFFQHHQQNQRMRVRSPESYVGATFEKTTQRRRRSSSRVGESSVTSSGGNKWRCDVCGYETAIARNLRIHNTSEKHQQNVALMERSLKQMSQNKGKGWRFDSTSIPYNRPQNLLEGC